MRALYLIPAVLVVILAPAVAAGQIPDKFTNLELFPKDISRAELVATMRGFATALGVRCTHCHVGPDDLEGMDFATDEKQTKRIARQMIRMVRTMNADTIKALPASDVPRQDISCVMCHRRATKPPRPLYDILITTAASRGATAAIDQYKEFRNEYLGSGLYDFREATLNIVATRLRETKKLDDAIPILMLNADLFPKSAGAQVALGLAAMEKGDLAAAETAFKTALEIEPVNRGAMQGLEEIRKKRG